MSQDTPTPRASPAQPQLQQPPPQQFDRSSVPIAELEATRIKLLNLTRSLHRLQDDIARGALPRWESLQNQYGVIITQLGALSSEVYLNYAVLAARNVYPLPTFPTTQQEGLLTTLLRKKPAPEVSEWVEAAEQAVERLGVAVDDLAERETFVEWGLETLEAEKENHNFFSVFTQDEMDRGEHQGEHAFRIEKRSSEDRPRAGMDVDQALRFIHTGAL